MTTSEQLQDRLSQLPPDERRAWETYFIQKLDEQAKGNAILDNLTPEQTKRLRAKIQEGMDSLESGDARPWDKEEFLEEVRQRRAAREQASGNE